MAVAINCDGRLQSGAQGVVGADRGGREQRPVDAFEIRQKLEAASAGTLLDGDGPVVEKGRIGAPESRLGKTDHVGFFREPLDFAGAEALHEFGQERIGVLHCGRAAGSHNGGQGAGGGPETQSPAGKKHMIRFG